MMSPMLLGMGLPLLGGLLLRFIWSKKSITERWWFRQLLALVLGVTLFFVGRYYLAHGFPVGSSLSTYSWGWAFALAVIGMLLPAALPYLFSNRWIALILVGAIAVLVLANASISVDLATQQLGLRVAWQMVVVAGLLFAFVYVWGKPPFKKPEKKKKEEHHS